MPASLRLQISVRSSCRLLRCALLGGCAVLACIPRGDLDEYSSGGAEPPAAGSPGQAPPASQAGSSQGGAAGSGEPSTGDAGSEPPLTDAASPVGEDAGSSAAGSGSDGAASSPRVLSTIPADGAAGVTRDTSLSIAFDVPMDRDSVEAAFSFDGPGQLTPEFRWDAAGMLLNVVLDAPLAYATGNDPAQVQPLSYGYRLSSAARALDGSSLRETRVSFTTLRQLSARLSAESDAALTGNWRSDGVYGTDGCAQAGAQMCIGDSSFGPNASYRGFASFDLSVLPAAAVALEQATFGLQISSQLGSPSAGLGQLLLEQVRYTAIGPDTYLAASEAQLGSVAVVQAGSVLSLDVLSAARSDWSAGRLAQVRLRFATLTDADGATDLIFADRASASLSVSYLLP